MVEDRRETVDRVLVGEKVGDLRRADRVGSRLGERHVREGSGRDRGEGRGVYPGADARAPSVARRLTRERSCPVQHGQHGRSAFRSRAREGEVAGDGGQRGAATSGVVLGGGRGQGTGDLGVVYRRRHPPPTAAVAVARRARDVARGDEDTGGRGLRAEVPEGADRGGVGGSGGGPEDILVGGSDIEEGRQVGEGGLSGSHRRRGARSRHPRDGLGEVGRRHVRQQRCRGDGVVTPARNCADRSASPNCRAKRFVGRASRRFSHATAVGAPTTRAPDRGGIAGVDGEGRCRTVDGIQLRRERAVDRGEVGQFVGREQAAGAGGRGDRYDDGERRARNRRRERRRPSVPAGRSPTRPGPARGRPRRRGRGGPGRCPAP